MTTPSRPRPTTPSDDASRRKPSRASVPRRRLAAAVSAALLAITGCGQATPSATGGDGDAPPALAFVEDDSGEVGTDRSSDPSTAAGADPASTSTTGPEAGATSTSTTTTRPPTGPGGPEEPFAPLPTDAEPTVVVTDLGVPVRLLHRLDRGWVVGTPCQDVRTVDRGTLISSAHVVLDPGHGGAEVGAATPEGLLSETLTEKDLNLRVAREAKAMLERAGATVVMTRTGDYTMTLRARGRLATALHPGLFVSIHHNGGAPIGDDRPGTIVFTKTGNDAADRFGGIFHRHLDPVLEAAAETQRRDYATYAAALDSHEAAIAAYDQSVAARDLALVSNGQVPPEATTSIPPTTTGVAPGQFRVPVERQPATTTTVAPTASAPIPVPESLPPPPPLQLEPVRQFHWSGAGNAGVRAWTRPDGLDFLGVLRHSADVPAVLVEYVYLSNPSEAELVADPAFVTAEAEVLADSIIEYFSDPAAVGTGHVPDQTGDQPIGGGGRRSSCVNPGLDELSAAS